MRRPPVTALILALATMVAVPTLAENPAEVKAEVPALADFHDVIFPLWHEAWPNKDVALMKELLPQAREGVGAIEKTELPGILRDKQAAWSKGVAALRESLAAYERAAAAGDQQALLDAVEQLHARYETLVRTVRPPMKEFDAYHQVLYQVFHKLMPAGDLDGLGAAAEEMAARCQVLAAAPLPKRFAPREASVRPALGELCARTEALREALKGGEVARVNTAVGAVHDQYQAIEKLFE
ncbi:MAG: hypothetical protein ACOY3Y_14730 [Acidobacteriota bacterium]